MNPLLSQNVVEHNTSLEIFCLKLFNGTLLYPIFFPEKSNLNSDCGSKYGFRAKVFASFCTAENAVVLNYMTKR